MDALTSTATPRLLVVTHERLGYWYRHLRPRFADWPVRWVETRSSEDLRVCLTPATSCPIVVLDLGQRVRAGLEDLGSILERAPNALVAVLASQDHAGVAGLAREIGAAHVFRGPTIPPLVARLLLRWLPLARRRIQDDGWTADGAEPTDPWASLVPLES